MASDFHRRLPRRLFPIGALIFSPGIDQLIHAGRLDPMPYFHRHARGDWGEVTDAQWQQNNAALQSGARLESHYVVTRELSIRIVTAADRSATQIALPTEA